MPTIQLRPLAGSRRITARAARPPAHGFAKARFRTLIAATVLALIPIAVTTAPAQAATSCTGDPCMVDHTVATPLGPVTVTVSSTNVVTVQLAPSTPDTVVFGILFTYPPGPQSLPGYTRTRITTPGGVINIDEILIPPGPPVRRAIPNLALVSLHPPSPCRVQTTGTTVTFTPITVVIAPGSPA